VIVTTIVGMTDVIGVMIETAGGRRSSMSGRMAVMDMCRRRWSLGCPGCLLGYIKKERTSFLKKRSKKPSVV
jgi:hypothetical protein